MMLGQKISIGLTNNPLIDIFLDSQHLFAWSCIDVVRRNSALVKWCVMWVKGLNVISAEASQEYYRLSQRGIYIKQAE